MTRRTTALLLVVAASGCRRPPTPPTTAEPAAVAPANTPAAPPAPEPTTFEPIPPGVVPKGRWSRAEVVSFYLQDKLGLRQARLYDVADGGFGGTGVGRDGRSVTMTVRRVPGGLVCDHGDDRGGRGRLAFADPPASADWPGP